MKGLAAHNSPWQGYFASRPHNAAPARPAQFLLGVGAVSVGGRRSFC